MSRFFRIYTKLLAKYPLGMQALQAGALLGLGDQIAQNYIEKRSAKNLDLIRTAQFAGIGFFIAGPATRTWYGILDKYFGSKGVIVVLKKVACDQLLFAPVFIAILLSTIALMQGHNLKSTKLKLKNEYTDILINNYKLWPIVQLLNFYFVPLHYQVLVVQAIAILWNTYISYRTNRDNYKIYSINRN
ncbi:PREDICTED: protein Mpv17 [Ceratosolen solmsi marchali]|uniref:Mitochondrial inner membrane protein Mpv17 n=1 Tax=Ceratosolen solmsi marchali TaxID=326594 RepID=A0AAJ6YE85_9HYME|nr:PREDICTED: protein Mpv17 [Ceratosolen solmsi marchali]